MFRLLVLCASFAVAMGGLLGPVAPIAYSAPIPCTQPNAYLCPAGFAQIGLSKAPLVFPHLIKKREVVQPASVLCPDDADCAPAKRSAVLANYFPSPYVAAPYAAAPYAAAPYAAAPYAAAPYAAALYAAFPSPPLPIPYVAAPGFPAHFIKKRDTVLSSAEPTVVAEAGPGVYSGYVL